MKNKQKRLQQFNITLDDSDVKVIDDLRKKYAINISSCFKIFIKKYLNQLESKNINMDVKYNK
jgi:hypothetical protein